MLVLWIYKMARCQVELDSCCRKVVKNVYRAYKKMDYIAISTHAFAVLLRVVCFGDDALAAVKVRVLDVRPPVHWSRNRMSDMVFQ